jgi:hypothetical protein
MRPVPGSLDELPVFLRSAAACPKLPREEQRLLAGGLGLRIQAGKLANHELGKLAIHPGGKLGILQVGTLAIHAEAACAHEFTIATDAGARHTLPSSPRPGRPWPGECAGISGGCLGSQYGPGREEGNLRDHLRTTGDARADRRGRPAGEGELGPGRASIRPGSFARPGPDGLFARRLMPHSRRTRVILNGDEIFTKVCGYVLGVVPWLMGGTVRVPARRLDTS